MNRVVRWLMPRVTRAFPALIRTLSFRAPPPAQARLLDLATAYWTSQAISVAAALGLADALAAEPLGPAELAKTLAVDADALGRLLRALASVGLLVERAEGRFSLSELGALLRTDHPGSLRAITTVCGQEWYRAWSGLHYSVATGHSAFEKLYGKGFFAYAQEHATLRKLFDEGMRGVSSMTDVPISLAYDFSRFARITDIGGGTGSQLVTILSAHQRLEGAVFDLPSVVADAQAGLQAEEHVRRRITFQGGDFMRDIPAGSDAYFMKSVLHDWSDEDAVRILSNCRKQMQRGSRLLIAEHVILHGVPQFGKRLDLMMLVILGGRERTIPQFQELLAKADLRLTGEFPTLAQMTLLEASVA